MPRWPKQYEPKDIQTAKEMILEGETTAAIRKETGMSRSYVIRLKNKYSNSIQMLLAQDSACGRKPAIDEFNLRRLFELLTRRNNIGLCDTNLWTLARIDHFVKTVFRCSLSRLQLSRYLKKICLYHSNPVNLLSKVAPDWMQNDYCSIAGEAMNKSAVTLFISSSVLTRDYSRSLTIKTPCQINSGEKNLVHIYWAITTKGQWYFMPTPNKKSMRQTIRFIEFVSQEIGRPLHLIVNRANDRFFFNDAVVGRIQRKGWQLHELPFKLPGSIE